MALKLDLTVENFALVSVHNTWSPYTLSSAGRIVKNWHFGQLDDVGKAFHPTLLRQSRIRKMEEFLNENNTAINKEVKRLLTS